MIRAALYVIAFAAIQMAAAWAFQHNIVWASAVASGATALLFILLRWTAVSVAWLRSGNKDLLLWCAMAAIGSFLPSIGLQELMPPLPNTAEAALQQMMDSALGYAAICLLAPVVEEMVFRGAVLRCLLDSYGRWVAIWLSALLFALVHGNPAQMPHALLMGALLGWMYAGTRSIVPGVVLHWVNNTAVYVFYRLAPDRADMPLADMLGSTAIAATAIVLSLGLLAVAVWQMSRAFHNEEPTKKH